MKVWFARRRFDDRGQLTPFVVTMFAALVMFAGLALDPGMAIAAKIRAIGQAQEAARAGAQAIDLSAYRADGSVRLDAEQAHQLAQTYLRQADADGTITVTEDTVTVTVTAHQPTQLLQLLGVDELTVTASGTAQPQPGATAPDP
ncbi:hypothetical protein [Streptomyces millisiae]|uniref:Flp pilus-assembly TadG-like N-terminal domain-containing protein n=1 Tax=Streptomyces millisiae TaxID=3075542 RepID=A0ABU2LV52_9ACTN|nr:hypothetical protein [Streptomyces sp. DSM 44918]MDT0321458.1 hypothetical protein [Streptomyces sp. DSM 44918]